MLPFVDVGIYHRFVVSGVDRLPDRDSALLIGAGLSDTTAYRATVYRLSVGPIRDNQADFPPILQVDIQWSCQSVT